MKTLFLLALLCYWTPPLNAEDNTCVGKLDLVFLIDASYSIDNSEFNEIKEFVKQLVSDIEPSLGLDFRVALVLYADNVYTERKTLSGQTTVAEFLDSFNRSSINVMTKTHLGLQEVFTMLQNDGRADATQVLLLITDGISDSRTLTEDVARQFWTTPIHILVLTLGLSDLSEAKAIAHNNRYVFPDDLANKDENPDFFLGPVKDAICELTHICDDKIQTEPLDLYFLIDWTASSAVYANMIEYIKLIINSFCIGTESTRVGVIGFNNIAKEAISISDYKLRDTLELGINSMTQESGPGPDASVALSRLNSQLVDPLDADRPIVAVMLMSKASTTDASSIATTLKNRGVKLSIVNGGTQSSAWESTSEALASDSSLVSWTTNFNNAEISANSMTQHLNNIALGTFTSGGGSGPTVNEKFDLIFALDGSIRAQSNTVGSLMIHSVKEMIKKLELGPDSGRVAVMIFDGVSVYAEIPLGDYSDKSDLNNKVDLLLDLFIERTDEADNSIAIDTAVQHIEDNPRPGAKLIVYLLTLSGTASTSHGYVSIRNANDKGIYIYKTFIKLLGDSVMPPTREFPPGPIPDNVYTVIDKNPADSIGSSETQQILDDSLVTIIDGPLPSYGPWITPVDLVLLVDTNMDLNDLKAFVNTLRQRFDSTNQGLQHGIIAYSIGPNDVFTSAAKLNLNQWTNFDISSLELSIPAGASGGTVDLESMFALGRGNAKDAVLVIGNDGVNSIPTNFANTINTAITSGTQAIVASIGIGQTAFSEAFLNMASHEELGHRMSTLTMTHDLEAQIIAGVCEGTDSAGILFMIDVSVPAQNSLDKVKRFVLALAEGFDVGLAAYSFGLNGPLNGIDFGEYTEYSFWYTAFNDRILPNSSSSSADTAVAISSIGSKFDSTNFNHKTAVVFTYGINDLSGLKAAVAAKGDTKLVIINTNGNTTESNTIRKELGTDTRVYTYDEPELEKIDNQQNMHDLLCAVSKGEAPKCTETIDLVLVIDTSSSMDTGFQSLQLFILELIDGYNVGLHMTRIAVVTIGDGAGDYRTFTQLTSAMDAQMYVVTRKAEADVTDTAAALDIVIGICKNESRQGILCIAAIFTDGKSSNVQITVNKAIEAKLSGINLLPIGLGSNVNSMELERVSTSGEVLLYPDFSDLAGDNKIADQICGVAMSYDPTKVPEPFTCEYTVDIIIVKDTRLDKNLNYQEFKTKLENSYGSDTIFEEGSGSTFVDNVEKASDTLLQQTAKLSTRMLIIIIDRDLTDVEKDEMNQTISETKSAGIVVTVIDLRVSPSADYLADLASNQNMYFKVIDTEELLISLCIQPCSGGTERLVKDKEITCTECKKDFYRDQAESYMCKPCGDNKITLDTGATSSSFCKADACSDSRPCENGGICDNKSPPTCECQNGFYGDLCQLVCIRKMDLVILVDISQSISPIDQTFIKFFLKNLFYRLGISDDKIRVAVIHFAEFPIKIHGLMDSQTYLEADEAANKVGTVDEGPNFLTGSRTDLAIREAMQDIANARTNDGRFSKIMLFTDGNDNTAATIEAAQEAKAEYIQLYVIGMFTTATPESLVALKELQTADDAFYKFYVSDNQPASVDDIIPGICEDSFTCDKDVSVEIWLDNRPPIYVATLEDMTEFKENFVTSSIPSGGLIADNDAFKAIGQPSQPISTAHLILLVLNDDLPEEVIDHLNNLKQFGSIVSVVSSVTTPVVDAKFSSISSPGFYFPFNDVDPKVVARFASRKCCVDPVCTKDEDCEDGWTCSTRKPNYCKDPFTEWCTPNPCQNGGTCSVDANSATMIRCECIDGYTGDRCEEVIDVCSLHPCKNGGICKLDQGGNPGYKCDCKDGNSGPNCEEEMPECSSSPCLNGGTCHLDKTKPEWYRCECRPGYTGDRCQEMPECSSSPCLNGGTCHLDKTKLEWYRCECRPGYTGDRCQEMKECSSSPCLNGGTCHLDKTKPEWYRCECRPGYTGERCQEMPECSSSPCLNGGTCHLDKTKPEWYRCECRPGYTGDRCQGMKECSSSPCLNGGTCHLDKTKPEWYRCECLPGYTGDRCQGMKECSSSPCLNGGTCHLDKTKPEWYRCECRPGYTGNRCQKMKECSSSPCLNGGTCHLDKTKPEWYRCECPPGYTGDRCQTVPEMPECSSSPCLNGGTCHLDKTKPKWYRCECRLGYTGDRCQEMPECSSSPCLNGGTCHLDKTKPEWYRCECRPGYTGDRCQEMPECSSSPCLNGGTCHLDKTKPEWYRCECRPGYTGNRCQEMPECSSSPCLNGGTCHLDKTKPEWYRCECRPGYTGDRCQEMPECSSSPCLNGGTCHLDKTKPEWYRCECPPGYTGDRCQTATDNECASEPCQNSGVCVWAVPYYCICTFTPISGYTGLSCETLVDCPAGSKFDSLLEICVQCPNGFYRGASDPDCLACPTGQVTGKTGSITAADCVPDTCRSGFEFIDGGCSPCEVGTYKNNQQGDLTCQQCPARYSTRYRATWSINSCQFVPCSGPLDLFIAVDMSNPVQTEVIQSWLKKFVRGFRLGPRNVRISILRFSSQIDCIIPLRYGTHWRRVCSEIKRQLYPGPTNAVNTTLALEDIYAQLQNCARPNIPTAALIINDNMSDNIIAAETIAALLKSNGVHMTSIGTVQKDVVNLASNKQSQFLITGYENLPSRNDVIKTLCG